MNVIINLQSFILVNKTTFIVISPSTMPCNICCITFMYQLMLIKWWQFDVRRYTQGTDMHLGCLLGLAMMFWIDGMHLSSLVIHVIMIRNARPQLFFYKFRNWNMQIKNTSRFQRLHSWRHWFVSCYTGQWWKACMYMWFFIPNPYKLFALLHSLWVFAGGKIRCYN